MHPRDTTGFEWDDDNEGHLAAHGVMPQEAEEVANNAPAYARNVKNHSGDYKMMGWTDSGRRLTIIVTTNPKTREMRVITGWEMDARDFRHLKGRRPPQ